MATILAEGFQNPLHGEFRSADHAVGRTVIESDLVSLDEVSIGEDDVAEKTLLLVFRKGFHDRFGGAGQHFPWFFQVEEQRP